MSASYAWWESLDINIRMEVIESLYKTYTKGLENHKTIKDLKESLETTKAQEIKDLEQTYTAEIKQLEEIRNGLLLDISKSEIQAERQELEYKKSMEQLEKELKFDYERRMFEIKQELENEKSKVRERDFLVSQITKDPFEEIKELIKNTNRTRKTARQLGAEGESLVDLIIGSHFADARVEDTSGQRNEGDRLVYFGETSILLEIKNVNQNTLSTKIQAYRDQIRNDLIIAKRRHNTNVGIMVSIDNVTYPEGKILDYEIMDSTEGKVCLMYCTNVESNPFLLVSTLRLARTMSSLLDDPESDETELLSKLRISLPLVNECLESLRRDTVYLENLQGSNKKTRQTLEKVISEVLSVVDIDMDFHMDKQEKLLKDVLRVYGNLKKTSEIKVTSAVLQAACVQEGLSRNVIRNLGGFKTIVEKYSS